MTSHRNLFTFQPWGTWAKAPCSWFQMMSFPKSPFPARRHFDVSGTVGGLSLTSPSGQLKPMKNLSENVEVDVGGAVRSQVALPSSSARLGLKVGWL